MAAAEQSRQVSPLTLRAPGRRDLALRTQGLSWTAGCAPARQRATVGPGEKG
ncbi:hypothetical protein BU14_0499s0009 [Porphyra umbilicalis]|uniref:Uncharacterized protein n=1 Tax=Porphyra umbilicalis TaxID=2786 RepID=A0A1X6NTA2_PORUM|nr:hypothetical protein BU14_0499s0009 [Porphyra umbilicalis]|eukprot:OSX71828.1 hypothetical protein BU14_0499s0009 [Porphyra umbilicalis]